jgi:signal transduction histidine kinase
LIPVREGPLPGTPQTPSRLGDIARPLARTVSPQATFSEALRAFDAGNVRFIVVADEQRRPIGLLDGFVLFSLLAESAAADLDKPVTNYVWRNAPVLKTSADPQAALKLLRERPDAHCVIVTDDAGCVFGFADQADLTLWEMRRLRETSRKMDAVLHDMREEIRRAHREMSDLIGVLSHDLRGPLGGIREIAALLKADRRILNEAQMDEFLRLIGEESSRLLILTNDVLELARVRAGDVPLNFARHNPAEIMVEVCAIYRHLAGRKKIGLDLVVVPGNPPPIWVDRKRILTVLSNLLDNAVKYCKADETITAKVAWDERQVVFEIADNGQGVAKEDLPKLFVRFGRTGSKPTAGEASTGLGLAIARELIEAHAGVISAVADHAPGLCIRILLPLHAAPAV